MTASAVEKSPPASPGLRHRVLSGMRPTGRLHIGHYFGALENWVKLQNDPGYECFFFIADWHALTSDYADTSQVVQNTLEIATDWLASGLVPGPDCTLFVQSAIPEHAELHLLLSMVTPLGWLERVPTYKEALDNVQDKDLHTYGFLGYPVLQTADIVMYGEPDRDLVVPVGEDQVSHVELSREIVRRFNVFYGVEPREELVEKHNGKKFHEIMKVVAPHEEQVWERALVPGSLSRLRQGLRNFAIEAGRENLRELLRRHQAEHLVSIEDVLREPDAMLTRAPRIPGTDGRKMSKSYGNTIMLSESDDSIRAKTRVMMTDPARKRRTDPGNPDVCPAFDWHKLFSPSDVQAWAAEGCRTAGIGCIECKAAMAEHLIRWIAPIRERRERYAADPAAVLRILDEGSEKARAVAQQTMTRVREAIFGGGKTRAALVPSTPAASKKAGD